MLSVLSITLLLMHLHVECAPCGPAAFWAFKDEIDSEVSLVVTRYADVSLRDELGQTLLHKVVLRKPEQVDIVNNCNNYLSGIQLTYDSYKAVNF